MRNNLGTAAVVVFSFWWIVLTGYYWTSGKTLFSLSAIDVTNSAVEVSNVTSVEQGEALLRKMCAQLRAVRTEGETIASAEACERFDNEDLQGPSVMRRLAAALCGALFGAVLVAAFIFLQRSMINIGLSGGQKRGLRMTIGPFPEPRKPFKQAPPKKAAPPQSTVINDAVWRMRQTYPEHAALFDAMLRVYRAYPHAPAGSGLLKHRNVSLFDHTVAVTERMLERAGSFQYKGIVSGSDGTLVITPASTDFEFDRLDPLILLAAWAHDIGKVECFIRASAKAPIQVLRRDHDDVGAWIVFSLPEFSHLPERDRDDLLMVLGGYHDPVDMALDVSEQRRAVAMLLHEVDIEVSKREGDLEDFENNVDVARRLELEASGVKELLTSDQKFLLERFWALIEQQGTLNGRKSDERLGFKFGDKVYLHERAVRLKLGAAMGIPLRELQNTGSRGNELTRRLLSALYRAGALYHVHDGIVYPPHVALWQVLFSDGDKPLTSFPAAILLLSESRAFLKAHSDCITGKIEIFPRFGAQAGIRHPQKFVQDHTGIYRLGSSEREKERAEVDVDSLDGAGRAVNYSEFDDRYEISVGEAKAELVALMAKGAGEASTEVQFLVDDPAAGPQEPAHRGNHDVEAQAVAPAPAAVKPDAKKPPKATNNGSSAAPAKSAPLAAVVEPSAAASPQAADADQTTKAGSKISLSGAAPLKTAANKGNPRAVIEVDSIELMETFFLNQPVERSREKKTESPAGDGVSKALQQLENAVASGKVVPISHPKYHQVFPVKTLDEALARRKSWSHVWGQLSERPVKGWAVLEGKQYGLVIIKEKPVLSKES